jgi:hypothetical protein
MDLQEAAAWVLGAVLVLAGLLGFFNDPLLGYFEVNTAHNAVHLITGIAFIWGALAFAKPANKTLGVIYILIAIIGFLFPLTLFDMNRGPDPDNFFHLGVGLAAALAGWLAK